MPAIQLSRLRIQTAQLADLVSQPDAFVRQLHVLLEFYSDRTHHPGRSAEQPPLMPAYFVPGPVLRQILLQVAPRLSTDQPSGLALCDRLWEQEYHECSLLAARIMGILPIDPLEPIQLRMLRWSKQDFGPLQQALLDEGLSRWRKEAPASFLSLLETWLKSSGLEDQMIGLRAMLPLLKNSSFDNLPLLFRYISPFIQNAPSKVRPDLLAIMEALARRSPKETAYFLRQNMFAQDTAWVTRQIITVFPVDIQKNLREAMKNPRPLI